MVHTAYNMNLLIDSISNPWTIIGFSKEQDFFSQVRIDIAMNESSKLIWHIDTFLKENNFNISDIEIIVVINGPGSFTWVRTTVLIANTLAFRTHIELTPLSYFDLFSSYPIIKQSSKRDVFMKKSIASKIEILSNSECVEYILQNNIKKIYWDFDIFSKIAIVKEESQSKNDIENVSEVDYKNIIFWITFQNKKQIEPLYIKKPNIS
jgi:tRNA A37 threonylcarbamoyladenosine modification protein TsaB